MGSNASCPMIMISEMHYFQKTEYNYFFILEAAICN